MTHSSAVRLLRSIDLPRNKVLNMIDSRHFKRLEHIYTSSASSEHDLHDIAIALGRAELVADINTEQLSPQDVANHAHYHDVLSDAASLAAGSLVEDQVVMAEQFDMQVVTPEFSGPVTASARVTLAQPPRYRVEVQLMTEDGDLLAQGSGVFSPTSQELPPDPNPEQDTERTAKPDPAVYASVWPSPFGVLHLN